MLTFFVIDRWMEPVIQFLLDKGVSIPYAEIPRSRLQLRVTICFGLIISGTALMIGTLASQPHARHGEPPGNAG